MLVCGNTTFTSRNKNLAMQEHSKHRTGKTVANPAATVNMKALK